MRAVRSAVVAVALTLAAVPAQAAEAPVSRDCAAFAQRVFTGVEADALTRACSGERANWITRLVDAFVCPVLMNLRGDHGPIAIGWDGDVWVLHGLFAFQVWDCPPYET